MDRVKLLAPAKINLFLRVLGRRPNGYHELETLFQAIDLYDELIIEKTTGLTTIEVPFHPELESEANLVLRGLRWIEARVERPLPVRFRLKKKIPTAGGLGGGSSDAAAALLGIRALFDLDLPDVELVIAAAQLGADVPFFLTGGTAVGEGIGEILTPVDLSLDYGLILINPGFQVPTARVFGELSRGLTGHDGKGRLWALIRAGARIEEMLHNDLQPVAEKLYPKISELGKALVSAGLKAVLMSGSGPTVFAVIGRDESDSVAARLPENVVFLRARPVKTGIIIC